MRRFLKVNWADSLRALQLDLQTRWTVPYPVATMEAQAPMQPQATPNARRQVVTPGSKESFDELADSLTYSFVDVPELLDDNGNVVEDSRGIKSFNPFVQQPRR